jgi:hypothetical protein
VKSQADDTARYTRAGMGTIRTSGTVYGEPRSKANSRLVGVMKTGKPYSRKHPNAQAYVEAVQKQLMGKPGPMAGRVGMALELYYCTERPDMDPSLFLDAAQGFLYENDRQVRELWCRHHIDRANPRVEYEIWALTGG